MKSYNLLLDRKSILSVGILLFLMTWGYQALGQTQATILNTNPTDQEILDALSGGGLTLSNPQLVNGTRDSQIAIFDNGFVAGFTFNQGVLFSTGDAQSNLQSHNNYTTVGISHGYYADPDLTGLVPYAHYDPVIFTFDLELDDVQNSLRIAFQFGSEEYPNYVASGFNDVFGFFVEGPGIDGTFNMARLPSNDGIVAINSVNGGTVGSSGSCSTTPLDLTQTTYYINNGHTTTTYMSGDCEKTNSNTNPGAKPVFIEFNGLTTLITYDLTGLTPGETYHFKIAIADTGDSIYDSGVLIKAIQGTNGADVAIQKEIDNPWAEPGETVEFTLTASNLGPFEATNIEVSDVLPSGYTFVSADASKGSYNETTGKWTFDDLAVAIENPTLTIYATVNESGNYENVATITAEEPDPDLGNNQDSAGINSCGVAQYYISQVKSDGAETDHTYNSGYNQDAAPSGRDDPTTPGYANNSAKTFTMEEGGGSFNFSMKADGNHPYADYYYEVWLDNNQDGSFTNTELLADSGAVSGGNYSFAFDGSSLAAGNYIMRFKMIASLPQSNCVLGETEDYTLIVTGDSDCNNSGYYINSVVATNLDSGEVTSNPDTGLTTDVYPATFVDPLATPGYGDYASTTHTVDLNTNTNVSIQIDADGNHLGATYHYKIMVDRNKDGKFENTSSFDEVFFDDEVIGGSFTFSYDLTNLPEYEDVVAEHPCDDYVLRIEMSVLDEDCNLVFGETEDYTLKIIADCPPGDGQCAKDDEVYISHVWAETPVTGFVLHNDSGYTVDADPAPLQAPSTPGYGDYRDMVFEMDLAQETSFDYEVMANGPAGTIYDFEVWMDRNQNNVFADNPEQEFLFSESGNTTGEISGTYVLAPEMINVPCGEEREFVIRIIMTAKYLLGLDGEGNEIWCEYGETEDYTFRKKNNCTGGGQCAPDGDVYISHVLAETPVTGYVLHNDSGYTVDADPSPLQSPSTPGYGDYRDMVFEMDLAQETSFDYEVTANGPAGTVYDFEVWMDRNRDDIFADGTEQEFLFSELGNTTGEISGIYNLLPEMINVPCGEEREFVIRIIMTAKYLLGLDNDGNEIWCEYGETEDYTFRKKNNCTGGGQCAPDGDVYISHVWTEAPVTGFVLHNDSGYTFDADPAPLQSPSTTGYGDYRHMVFEMDLAQETSFNYEVIANGPAGTIYNFEVYMDRNENNIFDETPAEHLFSVHNNTTGEISGTYNLLPGMINVPCGEEWQFVLRIEMTAKYLLGLDGEGNEIWCEYGETEDYTYLKRNTCCPEEDEVYISHVWTEAPVTGFVLHNDSGYTVHADPAPLQSPSTTGYGDYRDMVFEMDLAQETSFNYEVIANGPAGTIYNFEVYMDRNENNIFDETPAEHLFSVHNNTTGEISGIFNLLPEMINVPCGEEWQFVLRIEMTAKYLQGYDDNGEEIWCEFGETEDYTYLKRNICPPGDGQCAGNDFYINKVTGTDGNTFAENTSGYDSGYGDYTDIMVVVDLSNAVDGNPYFEFTIESDGNHSDVDYHYEAWVDRNQDGVFSNDELQELVWFETITGGSTSSPVRMYLGDFPEYNGEGCLHPIRDYTMRIIQVVDCVNPNGVQTFTETEDYTIRITGECPGEMSVEDVIFENFTYYPNPTTSVLTLKATNTIEEIALYNLLGQKVKQINPDSSEIQLNLEGFSTGLYLMEVKLDGVTRTFRVVKK